MKIGIYGGTFNPIHEGHIGLALLAKKSYGLDHVLFLPSGNSYMKENVLDPELRYQMVCLAIAGIDGFEASDLEIQRSGPTYSYETIEEFRQLYPHATLYFLMGEDSLRQIESWKEPARLMGQCSLIVAARPDRDITAKEPEKNKSLPEKSLRQYSEELERKYHTQIYCMEYDMPVSSSGIRELVKEGMEITGLVPEPVQQFILKEQLYR
ncbi:MAG: nicotinate-nucleotide adenylyltransferase [Lachnospiraceae bacterium]